MHAHRLGNSARLGALVARILKIRPAALHHCFCEWRDEIERFSHLLRRADGAFKAGWIATLSTPAEI
jgi:hypothetical protein